jgi:SulP family sulfate permease
LRILCHEFVLTLPRQSLFLPKSVLALRDYSWRKFGSDLVAGVTVGLVALPLAMAFAISSGVPPQSGLYCAVVAGFLISALGGSMTQIGGPTGAFVVVISGIVAKHEIDGLFMCTMMAGVMLGAIKSLLSATVADRMSGDKHNPNVELFAQGMANIFSPLVGGLPATGAIARTATNIRSGAKTPVAGMIHALTLLAILVFAAPLAKHIPLCLLSSILMIVVWNMGEWAEIPSILKLGKADASVWLITLLLTVFADLTVAVAAGMMLAGLLYIRRVTTTTTVSEVTPEYIRKGFAHSLQTNEIPEGVAVFRIHGPFLFGATDKVSLIEERIDGLSKVVVLRLRNMNAIDGTGLHALENLAVKLKAAGKTLVLCGIRDQPAQLMARADFHRHIGEENIQPSLEAAVLRALVLLAETSEGGND